MSAEALTHYPDLDVVLNGHARRLQGALGELSIGVYLVGSLAIGDFDMTSDCDFVVVTARELSKSQLEEVQAIHDQTYGQSNRWVKHLEYSFFPLDRLRHPSSPFSSSGRIYDENRELWHFDHGSPTLEIGS